MHFAPSVGHRGRPAALATPRTRPRRPHYRRHRHRSGGSRSPRLQPAGVLVSDERHRAAARHPADRQTSRPRMIAQGVRSLTEALQNVPGVMLNMGDGQRDQVVIRGLHGDRRHLPRRRARRRAVLPRPVDTNASKSSRDGRGAVRSRLVGRPHQRVSKMPTKQAIREITVQFDSEGEGASFDLGGWARERATASG